MEKNKHDLIDKLLEVINIFNPCIDDYLYVLDFRNDFFYISPNAIERFNLSENQFYNVNEKLKDLVYPADFELLLKDLDQISNNEKDFHNLQYRWMDKKGEPVWINCRGKVLNTAEGEPEFLVGCINEIGCKQKADNVSGLLGESSLQNELKVADGEHLSGFILRLGIDNFKEINENRGMDYGDMVLKRTAECIQAAISPNQKLYRIVADEFVVIDLNGGKVEDAAQLYKDIQGRIDCFIEENRYEVFYTISAGILNFSAVDDQSYYNLMRYAEFALNEAKNGGKNKYYIYSQIDYDLFQRKKDIIHIMRQAVNHDFEGFEAYFQPIMDINKNRLFSAETLLRFRTPETGVITPSVLTY